MARRPVVKAPPGGLTPTVPEVPIASAQPATAPVAPAPSAPVADGTNLLADKLLDPNYDRDALDKDLDGEEDDEQGDDEQGDDEDGIIAPVTSNGFNITLSDEDVPEDVLEQLGVTDAKLVDLQPTGQRTENPIDRGNPAPSRVKVTVREARRPTPTPAGLSKQTLAEMEAGRQALARK